MLKASNRNDDPARIRWINSDLIGFTNKMKNLILDINVTVNGELSNKVSADQYYVTKLWAHG